MIKFDVDEVQPWYEHVKKVLDENRYGDARITEPETAGDTKICHVIDPSGVLLIFVE